MIKNLLAASALYYSAVGLSYGESMKVAADVGYAPHIMATVDGYEGYSVDLMSEIAKRIGVEYELVDQEWSGIFAGLSAGKYVAIVAPTTVTTERAEKLLFGEPYLDKNYQFLLKSGGKQIDSLDDAKGLRIAVNKGNSFDKWLSDDARLGEYKWEVVRFGKLSDAIQAVVSGRADAAFDDESVMIWAARQNPLLAASNLRIPTGEFGSFVFDTKNPEMRARFEKAMECMKADGEIAKIEEKWFDRKAAEGGAASTIFAGTGVPSFPNYDESPSGSGCS